MNEELLNNKYNEIINLIENEFERNKNKYGEKIKCRKGCSQCCYQIFNITLVDAYFIKKYINTLSAEDKIELKKKSKLYLNKLDIKSNLQEEYLAKPKLPCPALNSNGECMIYDARPIICRRFGPPIYDYKNPDKIFACELNFETNEEIIDSELIPIQTVIGKKWDELKTEFNLEYESDKFSTSIAEAILDA